MPSGSEPRIPRVARLLTARMILPSVATCGSKEGWDTSDTGDRARAAFTAWLREADHGDWVEIQFGDDEGETRIVNHSDDPDQPSEAG